MRRRSSLALIVVVAVAGCGGNDPEPTVSPSPTVTAEASPTSTPTTPSPSPTDDVTLVEIVVADGDVEGGIARPEVVLGAVVRFEVTSDTTDHVHVHGYDLFEDVEAGGTAVLEFTADIPGKFEVELEDQHFKIAELTVSG